MTVGRSESAATLVHPLIQTARGHVADEDWQPAERVLALAVDAAKDLENERDELRAIIARAARMAESERAGMVLQILREALGA